MAAEHERMDVGHGDAELLRDERAHAARIEDARHADDAMLRKAAQLERRVRHRVERVRHDDENGVGRMLEHRDDDGLDDFVVALKQVVRLMPGLRGNPAVTTTTSLFAVSR